MVEMRLFLGGDMSDSDARYTGSMFFIIGKQ